ncbi:MAG TPA: chorismate lyase [Limnobacter sp.]|nr:chorismate lyase [Limnobacter sp.]
MNWQPVCPPGWPAWAKHWASTKGSLTLRLQALHAGFTVQPVRQVLVGVSHAPHQPALCTRRGVMRQRLVRLVVGGHAVVLAQTLVQADGPRNDWRFWRGLGARSLGSVLFADPRVKRGRLYFARLPARHPWVLRLLDEDGRREVLRRHAGKYWYARCARFEMRAGHTPLWVMEVFLPQLQNHS